MISYLVYALELHWNFYLSPIKKFQIIFFSIISMNFFVHNSIDIIRTHPIVVTDMKENCNIIWQNTHHDENL